MTSAAELPAPPSGPPQPFGLATIEGPWHRINWGRDLLPTNSTRWRFDAPASEYGVSYANETEVGALLESFLDPRLITERDLAHRYPMRIAAARPLELIDLTASTTRAALGVDNRISTSVDYRITQAWSSYLWTHTPDADGIRFGSRKADTANICLFDNHCGSDLRAETDRTLGERRDLLEVAIAHQIAVVFPGLGLGGSI